MASFWRLPPELREQIYVYIAEKYISLRRILRVDGEYRTILPALAVTSRLVYHEYEDVARKTIMIMDFTIVDMDFTPIIDYFHNRVDAKYLATLQQSMARLHVNIIMHRTTFDIRDFYTWALFLIDIDLTVVHWSDRPGWRSITNVTRFNLPGQCTIEDDTPQAVQDRMEDIRKIARSFDMDGEDAEQSY